MSNELEVMGGGGIVMSINPQAAIDEAKAACTALIKVVDAKKDVVKVKGKIYLTFEDWQMLGRFYGLTAKVVSTTPVDFGGVVGFESTAEVINGEGMVVSSAESMCLNDEDTWGNKPLFQLRSMAQTRACAKAFRNCLAWVAVMSDGKFGATPAEEMDDYKDKPKAGSKPAGAQQAKPAGQSSGGAGGGSNETCSEAQSKKVYAMVRKAGYTTKADILDRLNSHFDTRETPIESTKELTKAEASSIIKALDEELAQGGE